MQPKRIALLARQAAEDKQAVDPIILDVAKLTSAANYFFIAHGNSDRQVRAIAEHIVETLKKKAEWPWHVEGLASGEWVLVDYGTVLVHVFYRETRSFYSLETLWGDSARVK